MVFLLIVAGFVVLVGLEVGCCLIVVVVEEDSLDGVLRGWFCVGLVRVFSFVEGGIFWIVVFDLSVLDILEDVSFWFVFWFCFSSFGLIVFALP